jgi:cell wall-associated NlpC family hydrolase
MQLQRIIYSIVAWWSMIGIYNQAYPTQAVTIVPVADLVGKPLKINSMIPVPWYNTLPFQASDDSCPRIHQLIFNEIVTIVEEQGEEICVQVTNIFYEQPTSSFKNDTYWTLRKNVIALAELHKKGIDSGIIPQPLSYKKPLTPHQQKNIATLKLPWHDSITHTHFSVGTRFVIESLHKYSVKVSLIHPHKLIATTIEIPREYVSLSTPTIDKHKAQKDFVTLVTTWARQGSIPYVWGGISFTTLCPEESWHKVQLPSKRVLYERPGYQTSGPKTGFDCTGLIARAAQICNIPYYFKNTNTLIKYLKPLDEHSALANGDLLWFPGHVLIITDMHKGLFVEARGYAHGFGKVQEIPFSHVFQDIRSAHDLTHAFFKKKILKRLDHAGQVVQLIPDFRIFKLASVWLS